MITEEEISRHCYARTFQRARQIEICKGDIRAKQCTYNYYGTEISASISSSSSWNESYRTFVTIDEDEDAITDYSCSCPAYINYDGMCKHAAALALSFARDPAAFDGYKEAHAPQTSPSVAAFLERSERAAQDSGPEPAASVALDPTLTCNFGQWSVRFKVRGARGAYVVKNIRDFLLAVQNSNRVSYGKKLAFTHAPDAFEPSTRKIIALLQRIVKQRDMASPTYWRSYSIVHVQRDLDLTDGEAIELLDCLESRTFDVVMEDMPAMGSFQARIVNEDPDVALCIHRNEGGGYVLNRQDNLAFISEGARLYILCDNVFYRCSEAFGACGGFLREVYQSDDATLFISIEDMPLFCERVLPALEKSFTIEAPSELALLKPVPIQLEFYFDFDRKRDAIDLLAYAAYGQTRHVLAQPPDGEKAAGSTQAMSRRIPEAHAQSPSDAANGAKGDEWDDAQAAGPLRDKAAENRALALIAHYFGNCASLNLSDEKNAGELLFGGLVRFRELGEVYTTPAFDRLITEKKPRTTLGLSLAGNLISLDVSSDDLEPAELAALLRSYRKRKRYHRLRSGAYLSMEDLDIHELDHLAEDLGLSPKDIAQGHIELPTYRAFYLDREFADAKRDESFRSYIERFHAIDQTSYAPPDSLASVLRPYQLEGFAWLSTLTDLGFGGILADEMGLGKSVQLISLLLARREQAHAVGASLIVCPASLVYNWLAEFSTFAPMLNVTAVEGGKTARRRIYAQADTEVFVVSYDLARRDIDDIQNMHFYCCVLDEAQYIKNHATLTTRAIKRIDATHRLALTGTPIENRLSEIWSIFDFLMPGFLGTYEHFRRRYEAGILGGDEQAANRLGSLVGPFILRRQKSDVLPDLPEKIESVTYVALAGEQRKVYNALEQQLRTSLALQKKEKFAESKVEVLAELTRLRQAALDPALLYENYRGDAAKTTAIVDLIEQACDAGEKTLVFSQFTSYLSTLADKLAHRGLAYFTITGATPKKQRLAKVNAFNQDDTPVFLVSLKAGGTGLNLTGASVVIHADPWWNAAAVDQATDRAHRIGQQHVVNVYKVIAKDTIEERILKLQLAKVELADAVVGRADALSLSSLTREELVNLLSG